MSFAFRVPVMAIATAVVLAAGPSGVSGAVEAQARGQAPVAGRGTVKGHIQLMGKLPGNPVIRMGMDPMCAKANAGKLTVQELVVAARDGSLANVFVKLDGTFAPTPVPSQAVTVDQHGCVYSPRVVGVRTGQPLTVKNSDPLLHNVHGLSGRNQGFNVGQPLAGMTNQFRLKEEEVLHLKCDVHSWMNAYVGVVSHPYFAVSNTAGTFEIANVPPGTYKIQAWHERYGPLTMSVTVKAGAVTTVDFAYTGNEKAPTVDLLVVPSANGLAARLIN